MSEQPAIRFTPVHPNSMAARKWKRKTWRTNLWAEAAIAARHGDEERARALRRAAAKQHASTFEVHCR